MRDSSPQEGRARAAWPIEDRLSLLLKEQLGYQPSLSSLWRWLETWTGVGATRWRNFHTGQQKVSVDMIEAACHLWPHYAFWLATGITDTANGHIAPDTALNFPEHSYVPDEYTNTYFKLSLELNSSLAKSANISALEPDLRRAYLERLQVLGTWTASGLLSAAYELSSTPEYKRLEQAWNERNNQREEHIKQLRQRKPEVKTANSVELRTPDQRTMHQHDFDLFYKPKSAK